LSKIHFHVEISTMVIQTKLPAQKSSKDELPQNVSLFGPPPLLEGENPAEYQDLFGRISAVIKPKDMLDEIWVRDVVDLTWEIQRTRRLKVALLNSFMPGAVRNILEPILGYSAAGEISRQWAARNGRAVKHVNKLIKSMGLTFEAVAARALSNNIEAFEKIDRMIMNAEARRNAALRESDRHRASVLELQQALDDVVDAAFEDVTPAQRAQKDAA
jgi:hypothetical protein